MKKVNFELFLLLHLHYNHQESHLHQLLQASFMDFINDLLTLHRNYYLSSSNWNHHLAQFKYSCRHFLHFQLQFHLSHNLQTMLLFSPQRVSAQLFCEFTAMVFIFISEDFAKFISWDLNVHPRSFEQFTIVSLYLFLFIPILIFQLIDFTILFKVFQILIFRVKDFLKFQSIVISTNLPPHSIKVCLKIVNQSLHCFSHYEIVKKRLGVKMCLIHILVCTILFKQAFLLLDFLWRT